MNIANIGFFQIVILWITCIGMTLIGAMVKGGSKLVASYILLSLLLGPIALVMLIFDHRKACPFCHSVLKPNLKVCPHCEHRLVYAQL